MKHDIIQIIIVLICLAIAWAVILRAPVDAMIKWMLYALSGLLAVSYLMGWL